MVVLKTWNIGSWPVRMVFLVLMRCTAEFVGNISWLLNSEVHYWIHTHVEQVKPQIP